MRDELAEQNKLLEELMKNHDYLHKELVNLDSHEKLGFHPDCKFLS